MSNATTRAPIVWRDPSTGPSVEGYCLECKEELFAGYCACGGPAERVGRMFVATLRAGEKNAALEAAARRWIDEGDQSDAAYAGLMGALKEWLAERERHDP